MAEYQVRITRKEEKTISGETTFSRVGGPDTDPKYDHVTKPDYKKIVDTEVYNQTVPEIDVLDVLAAVNGVSLK